MSEKKKKKNVVFDLPEDIIVKILCRLPVKTLIGFTCVSKSWRSIIISDPQFAKSQLKLASQQKALCHRFLVSILSLLEAHIQCRCDFLDSSVKKAALSQLHTKFRTLDLEAPTQFGNASSVKILTSPFEGLVRPMATCNGLVILGDVHCTNLSIWNPSTAFFRKIPDPGIWAKMSTKNGNRRCAVFVCCGFGYVSATDDYKFVILFHDSPFLLGVHVFSVRDNSWKIVQVPGIHDDWIFSSKGVLSNEVLHWITKNKTNELVISAFDLAEEEFHKESLLFPADEDCNVYDPDYNICEDPAPLKFETLKMHLPFSGQEGLLELKRIGLRFEEKVYTTASSQSDYLQTIALKMLTIEGKEVATSPPSNLKRHRVLAFETEYQIFGFVYLVDTNNERPPEIGEPLLDTLDWRSQFPVTICKYGEEGLNKKSWPCNSMRVYWLSLQ